MSPARHSPRYHMWVEPGDAWLLPGDMHFGCEDAAAHRAMILHFEAYYRKHRRGVCLQGDTLDTWGLSNYPRKRGALWDRGLLAGELDRAIPFLTWAGKTPLGCLMILGNHEDRLNDWLDTRPEVHGLPGASFGKMTGLDTIKGLEILDWNSRVWLGDKVCVRHGDAPGFPKKPHLVTAKYPDQFTIYGHTHRLAKHLTTYYDEEGNPQVRGALNVGHLSQPPDYCDDPDWQLGFAVVEFFGSRTGDAKGAPFFRVSDRLLVKDRHGEYHVA